MSVHPQTQSPFVSRFPREIRNAVYLEMWRSCGLRQHILWHNDFSDQTKSHFCRWACSTEFEVDDGLQREIEALRAAKGVHLGSTLQDDQSGRRLQSPWLNHWACGEKVAEMFGVESICQVTTSGPCFKKGREGAFKALYMPMLLLCRLISEECLESIYESTTFVFNNMLALQMFLGFCTLHPLLARWPKIGVPPSGFFKYARSLEISLAPSFPWQIPCSNPDFHEVEALRHDPNDFHWLRLEKLSRLRSIDIWVASRSISLEMGTEVGFTALNQLEVPALERAVSCFANIQKVTLSTPLHGNVEPEDGWMEGLSHSNVRVWKRGTGDRFHPLLVPPNPGKPLDGIIYTSQRREVRVGLIEGSFLVPENW